MRTTKSVFFTVLSLLGNLVYSQTTLHVAAPSGLVLRSTPADNGAKLLTVPYGESVELLKPAADHSRLVDGLPGGMAQVTYEGKTGYIFDGYLLRIPVPLKGEAVQKYIPRLRSTGAEAIHEIHGVDYGTYFTSDEVVHLQEMKWSEAFLLARNLFGIPSALPFFPEKGRGNETIDDPDTYDGNGEGEWSVTYNLDETLKQISYRFRGGAGGYSVMIERSTQSGFAFKISRHDFAD